MALDTITIIPQRSLGPITALLFFEERGTDKLTITRHPVEQGASITDHAYQEPAQVMLRAGATNSAGGDEGYVTALYAQILALQASRSAFSIQTGKRLFTNMLIESLELTTDEKTEAALALNIACTQIIIVQTGVVSVPPSDVQANPAKTAAIQNSGTKQPQVSPGVSM
jgi:hypothetical protein